MNIGFIIFIFKQTMGQHVSSEQNNNNPVILETRPTQLPESVPLFGSKGKNNKCKLDFLGPMIGPGPMSQKSCVKLGSQKSTVLGFE